MGVTVEVIQKAIRRAGLKMSCPDCSMFEPWEIPAYYRPLPRMKPCPIVRLDGRTMPSELDALYLCQCREKDRSIAVVPYSVLMHPGRNRPFTMHFSRYMEGTQHPLKPAGVMIQSQSYGIWVGQCPECMTIYVAQKELR